MYPWTSIASKYLIGGPGSVVVFDPGTLLVGATLAGGALSATSTLAGGSMAAQAGKMARTAANFQADQINQNASQAIASGQRAALDTEDKTRLAISTATARTGAGGVAADTGSPLADTGELAQRGSYHALMDMFNGESKATGLENEAAGIRYTGAIDELEGEQKQKASYLAAGGEFAGSIGSAAGGYGKLQYPTFRGSAGAGL